MVEKLEGVSGTHMKTTCTILKGIGSRVGSGDGWGWGEWMQLYLNNNKKCEKKKVDKVITETY